VEDPMDTGNAIVDALNDLLARLVPEPVGDDAM
jgi:hypothetical protein